MKEVSIRTFTILMLVLAATLTVSVTLVRYSYADHSGHPSNPIDQNNWKVSWAEDTGDGLRIGSPVQYKASSTYHTVIDKAKIPSIYVYYSNGVSFKDELPLPFPHDHTQVYNHFDKHNIGSSGWYFHHWYYYGCGASIWPQNGCYKYTVYYSFRDDNQKLSPWIEIWGPGFTGYNGGDDYGNPIYRTHWRMGTSIFDAGDDGFATYTGSSWSVKTTEYSQADPGTPTTQGYQWKTFDFPQSGESFYIDPYSLDSVTWHDGSTKKATIYVVKENSSEDQGDSTGSPAGYVNGETIASSTTGPGSDITIWYAGYMNWDARGCSHTSPCVSGADWYAKDFS
jgi:hypothetical protein